MLMIAAAAAVFANGTQEADADGIVRLDRGDIARSTYLDDLKPIDVKGTLNYESSVPELVSGGKSYTLFAPGAMMFSDYVREGDKLSVKGYILDDQSGFFGRMGGPGYMFDNKAVEGNTTILVESVEFNGKTYELPWVGDDDGFCGPGGFGGMRGGFSRGGFSGRGSGYGGMMRFDDDDTSRPYRRF